MPTLVKTKIVLGDGGTSVTTFFWKKWFWIFGYWYPYGTHASSRLLDVRHINDDNVSIYLYKMIDNF
jgi:hypothetical protein